MKFFFITTFTALLLVLTLSFVVSVDGVYAQNGPTGAQENAADAAFVDSGDASAPAPSSSFFGLTKPNLIVCGDIGSGGSADHECGFNDLIALAKQLVNFAFYLSVPAVTILFSYAGFLYLTAGDNEGQVNQAHTIFTNVAIGFMIVLAAWLIVGTLLNALLNKTNYPGVITNNQINLPQ